MREKFWKRDEKARSRGEAKMTFTNLLEMLQFRAGILNAARNFKDPTAKIAAIASVQDQSLSSSTTPERPRATSYAKRVEKSPPITIV